MICDFWHLSNQTSSTNKISMTNMNKWGPIKMWNKSGNFTDLAWQCPMTDCIFFYFRPTVIFSTVCPIFILTMTSKQGNRAKKMKCVNHLVQIRQPFRQQMINVICANLLLVPTKTIAQPGIVAKLTHSRAVEASNTKIQTSVITFRKNTTKSYYTSTLLLFMYTHRFYIDEFFQHISTVFQSLQRKPVKIQGRILLKWFSWKRADIFSAS